MKAYYLVTYKDGSVTDGYGIEEALQGGEGIITEIVYIEGMREIKLSDEAIRQAQDYIDSKISYSAEMAFYNSADYEYEKMREEAHGI